MSHDWKEAEEKRINIPDTDPETVEGYLNWIYTKQITLADVDNPYKECRNNGSIPHECIVWLSLELTKMYIFGDYLNDLQFCNAIVDLLRASPQSCKTRPIADPDAVAWVWERTAIDCPLRKYCLEVWTLGSSLEWFPPIFQNYSEILPKQFIIDLLVSIGKQYKIEIKRDFQAQKESRAEKCKYHKHVDDSDKCD